MICALLLAFTRLPRRKLLRRILQLVALVYLGFVACDMVSQALLVGWARSVPPLSVAPGLVLLVSAALLAPMLSRRQLYCHYLCPHGVAQELIARASPRRVKVPPRVLKWLELLPGMLLAWVVLVAMVPFAFDLTGIEAFDAYTLWLAGGAAIVVALVGLIAAVFIPMAYCKFGCPTGALLEFLRFNGRSDRLARRDGVALTLLGADQVDHALGAAPQHVADRVGADLGADLEGRDPRHGGILRGPGRGCLPATP